MPNGTGTVLRRLLANLLIAFGLALMLGTGTLLAYSTYEQQEAERQYALADQAEATAVPEAEEQSTPPSEPPAVAGSPRAAAPSPTPKAVARSEPLSLRPAAAKRLAIPAIGVNTRVVEAKVVSGEWLVPKFVAGHLAGTAQPGQGRNVVIAGHVESIVAGNVFARLDELEPGDEIRVTTSEGEIRYVVRGLKTVKPKDLSVVAPGNTESLTLVTCTGTWNPITGQYSHRLIALAEPVSFTAAR